MATILSRLRCVSQFTTPVMHHPDVLYHSQPRGTKIDQHIVYAMMTSSNGNIFRVTGPLCREFTGPGEFPTQRPVARNFDVFFDLRLNKRLSKQS